MVGIAYIFQQLGILGGAIDLTVLVAMLPWLAGILIILLGFGVLSWRPGRTRKRAKAKRKLAQSQLKAEEARSKTKASSRKGNRKLIKSRDKKACWSLPPVLQTTSGMDPTLVRIAFVIGTIASGGPFLLAYIIMAFVMPDPDKKELKTNPTPSERITIIRDS